MTKRWWLSHLLRWIVIIAFLLFFLFGSTSHPFDLEKSLEGSLLNMEMPTDVEVVHVSEDQNLYSVLFVDKENGLYHQSDYKKRFGLFWIPAGGGYGYKKDPSILAKYQTGMSTHGKKRFFYILGYVDDPNIHTVKMNWGNDQVESMEPTSDGFYQFVKATSFENDLYGNGKVEFYGQNKKLLYSLDYELNQIEK